MKPVCIPERDVPVGSECYITGWGKIRSTGRMHGKLQQVSILVEKIYKTEGWGGARISFHIFTIFSPNELNSKFLREF